MGQISGTRRPVCATDLAVNISHVLCLYQSASGGYIAAGRVAAYRRGVERIVKRKGRMKR